MDIRNVKLPKIRKVEPIGPLKLLVTYDNEQKKSFDVSPYLKRFDVFRALSDEALFKKVHTNYFGDALVWNKSIDICGYDVWELGISV
jgi:hypothetical protein